MLNEASMTSQDDSYFLPEEMHLALLLNRLPKWAAEQLEAVRERHAEQLLQQLLERGPLTPAEREEAKAEFRRQMPSVPMFGAWWIPPSADKSSTPSEAEPGEQ